MIEFFELVEDNPIIAAVKDDQGLRKCCELSEAGLVFVLYGSICSIKEIVEALKGAGKKVAVDVDLITGLDTRGEVSADFIARTGADAIISTKQSVVKRAKELGMITIFRVFVLDSLALQNIDRQLGLVKPDFLEILPGTMPKIIRLLCSRVKTPVIASGLISDKEDVMAALSGGAVAVSSTNQVVWELG